LEKTQRVNYCFSVVVIVVIVVVVVVVVIVVIVVMVVVVVVGRLSKFKVQGFDWKKRCK
jgi:hypothetical protein